MSWIRGLDPGDSERRGVRILVLSDIHSNLEALEAVLGAAGTVDQVWCLGDIVGYGPRPNECVARLKELKHLAVAGNHDHAVVGVIGIEEFNLFAGLAAHWTSLQLTDETREYLTALRPVEVSGEFTLVHGSPRDPLREYLLTIEDAAASFEHFDGPFCLVGHTHVPTVFARGPDGTVQGFQMPADRELPLQAAGWRFILNPGSVGQPRDEDPRAAYLLIDSDRRSAVWRRVEYNIAETQRQMREAKLPARLADRLADGT